MLRLESGTLCLIASEAQKLKNKRNGVAFSSKVSCHVTSFNSLSCTVGK